MRYVVEALFLEGFAEVRGDTKGLSWHVENGGFGLVVTICHMPVGRNLFLGGCFKFCPSCSFDFI